MPVFWLTLNIGSIKDGSVVFTSETEGDKHCASESWRLVRVDDGRNVHVWGGLRHHIRGRYVKVHGKLKPSIYFAPVFKLHLTRNDSRMRDPSRTKPLNSNAFMSVWRQSSIRIYISFRDCRILYILQEIIRITSERQPVEPTGIERYQHKHRFLQLLWRTHWVEVFVIQILWRTFIRAQWTFFSFCRTFYSAVAHHILSTTGTLLEIVTLDHCWWDWVEFEAGQNENV